MLCNRFAVGNGVVRYATLKAALTVSEFYAIDKAIFSVLADLLTVLDKCVRNSLTLSSVGMWQLHRSRPSTICFVDRPMTPREHDLSLLDESLVPIRETNLENVSLSRIES